MSKTKNINNSNLFITNDDLKGHIHNIHNYIRNNGLGYGKRALEIFNFLYGLKLIESKLDLLGISKNDKEIIKFSNILKQAKIREYHLEGKPTTEKINDALTIIESLKYKELYKYILYDVPTTKQGIKEIVWITLLKLIDDIPVGYEQNKVNLSGKVYEYFIGRDQTAISELGAYFSDRHITSFCFNKVKPILNENNTVKSMIDMFGGSGGFTLGYVSYLIEKYNNIDWKENINNILEYSINDEHFTIIIPSGKYTIDELIDTINKYATNITLSLDFEQKIILESFLDTDIINLYPTHLSTINLGFININSEDKISHKLIATQTWDLRINDKVYLYLMNIADDIPFGLLFYNGQSISQFRFENPFNLIKLDINFKDVYRNNINFNNLPHTLSFLIEQI
jgi:hypothetical protein